MPATTGFTVQQDDNNAAEGWQTLPSRISSSASSIFANPDEDWRTSTDFEERRRIQSRIAQRQYRQRQKQKKSQQRPGKAQRTTQPGPVATEMVQEDFSALEISSGDVQQQPPYPLSDQSTPEVPHQQFVPSSNEYVMSQHQPFVPQLPSPPASSNTQGIHITTTSPIDTDGQSQLMYNLNNLSVPATPQSERPQLLSGYAMPSQQPIPHVTYPSPSYTWTCRTTPDHQPTCSSHSSHHRPFRPQSHHCQQHNHDCVTYSQQNTHHDSTSPSPCGCSSSSAYYPSHSHYNTPQPLIRGHHELDKAWVDRKDYIRSSCAQSGCCQHHKGPMNDYPPSAWSRPYVHTPLPFPNRQTCSCGHHPMHDPTPDIRYLL